MPQVNISTNYLVFDDLTDVTITTPTSGNIVYYNGSQWNNITPSGLRIVEHDGSLVPGSVVFVDINGRLTDDTNFSYSNDVLQVSHITSSGTGNNNECFGLGTGDVLTTGGSNTLVGRSAGNVISTGSSNTLIGYQAGDSISTGSSHTAIGKNALSTITGSSYATVVGCCAAETAAVTVTAFGAFACTKLGTGTGNVGVGYNSSYWNISGSNNTCVGVSAGEGQNTYSYSNNTIIGYGAGSLLTTGGNNIFVGYQAGNTCLTGAGNIVVGYDCDVVAAGTSNSLNIGNVITGSLSTGAVSIPSVTSDVHPSGHLYAYTANKFDIGQTATRWENLYVNKLHAGSISGIYLNPGTIDHNVLLNWDTNKHVDHSITTFTAGSGLIGGGTLASNRTFDIGAGFGITVLADTIAVNSGVIDHDKLLNYSVNKHLDHTSVTFTAGSGLIGGGTLESNRTFDIGAGTGITVGTDTVGVNAGQVDHNSLLNYLPDKHVTHGDVSIIAGSGLVGGGTISSNRTLDIGAGFGITVFADTIAVNSGVIDHDKLLNYLPNKHIDHSTISIIPVSGLSGGGDLTSNVPIGLNIFGLSENMSPASGDYVVTENSTGGTLRKVKLSNLPGGGSEGSATFAGLSDVNIDAPASGELVYYNGTIWNNITPAEMILARSTVTLIAGSGLVGGGTLEANRTFDIGAGTGITVSADTVGVNVGQIDHNSLLNWSSTKHIDHASVSVIAGSGLVGGGTLESNRTFDIGSGTGITVGTDGITTNDSQIVHNNLSGYDIKYHKDHSIISIVAGSGLVGGGTIESDRTLNIGAGFGITVDSDTIAVNSGIIDHNKLLNYLSDKHITHADVSMIAGSGLVGGGTLSASRTFDIGRGTGITVTADAISTNDSEINHNLLLNYSATKHTDHATVSVVAGSGLIGGGTLESNRTFDIGSGFGITVSADTIAVNSGVIDHNKLLNYSANRHIDHTAITLSAGDGLTGGGDISTNRTFTVGGGTGITVSADGIATNDSQIVHDNLSGGGGNRHIDHSAVTFTAGSGLVGGGTLASNRTFDIGQGSGIAVSSDSIKVDIFSLPENLSPASGDFVMSENAVGGTLRKVKIGNFPGGGSSTTFDGLTDVTITTPTSGNLVYYNGSQWNNASTSELSLAERDGSLVPGSVVFVDDNGKLTDDSEFRYTNDLLQVLHITSSGSGGGVDNECFGLSAGNSLTTGISNVLVGKEAAISLTTGSYHTAVGSKVLSTITGSSYATAVGYSAAETAAVMVTAFGAFACNKLGTGTGNVGIGYNASYYNATGSSNTCVGVSAGEGSVGNSYSNNTFIGYQSGYSTTTGGNNVCIGYQAGNSCTTGAGNIVIGYDCDILTATTSNSLNIGNVITGSLATGNIGIGTISPHARLEVFGPKPVDVNGYPQLGITALDAYEAGSYNPRYSIGLGAFDGGFYQAEIGFIRKQYDNQDFTGDLFFATARPGAYDEAPIDRMVITRTGNVGIGTTIPLQKLHVIGNIATSGNLFAGNTNTFDIGEPAVRWENLYVNHLHAGSLSGIYLNPGTIDHDVLLNSAGNKHIDHTTVTLTAGSGLIGGGTLASNRTFDIGSGFGITVSADTIAVNSGVIDHDKLLNYSTDRHIAHTAVTLSAGNGLTGGGDISTNRTFTVGGGTGITVGADGISTNDGQIVHDNLSGGGGNKHIDHTAVTLTAGSGLIGGGDISTNRIFDIGAGAGISVGSDTVALNIYGLAENLAPASGDYVVTESSGGGTFTKVKIGNFPGGGGGTIVTLTAGSGLVGGGDTSANRIFDIGAGFGITVLADTIAVNSGVIDHDKLLNYLSDRHVPHANVILSAGNGLTGGGDISVSRTFTVGGGTGITVSADGIATNDSQIVHDSLNGAFANEHIDHSLVSIIAGSGIIGGGTLESNRTFDIGSGFGITVSADTIAVNSGVIDHDKLLNYSAGKHVANGTSGQTLRNDGTGWIANSLLYNDGTNIGIGTTVPGAQLDIINYLRILGSAGAVTGYPASGEGLEITYDITGNTGYITSMVRPSTFGNLVLQSNGGSVGIGTSAPADQFSVAKSTGTSISITTALVAGSIASPLNLDISFRGYDNQERARIRSWDESNNTTNGYLTFWTNGSSFAERWRIDTDGHLIDATAGGPQLMHEASSSTNPTLISSKIDLTSGIGGLGNATPASSYVSAIVNGGEICRFSNSLVTMNRPVALSKTTLTIVDDVVTVSRGFHLIAGAGGSDDILTTISGGTDGQLLVIRAASDSVTITVDNGGGNLALCDDFVMDDQTDTLFLIYDSSLSKWIEISRACSLTY